MARATFGQPHVQADLWDRLSGAAARLASSARPQRCEYMPGMSRRIRQRHSRPGAQLQRLRRLRPGRAAQRKHNSAKGSVLHLRCLTLWHWDPLPAPGGDARWCDV